MTNLVIKVCGITRREDAEAAVAAGATALGFIFYPKSPRYVPPVKAAELGEGLMVWKVGIFVEETAAAVEEVMRAAKLDVAQIYGGDAASGTRVWRAYRTPNVSLDNSGCEAVLIDGPANGQSFDWQTVRNIESKLIVAGGLDASNVAEAIRITRPWGVDASSKLESAPGVKDHDKVRAFVAAARTAAKEYVC
jgi:phosphoribosylanthranilate isomerase